MTRVIGVVLTFFVIVLSPEVGAIPQNKYISAIELDADAIQNVRTIALLEAADPEAYYFAGGKPGAKSGLFGTVGLLAEYVEMSKHGDKYFDMNFPEIVTSYIAEFLTENGFRVVEHSVNRRNKIDLLPDYSAIDLPGVDAYLDVAPVEIGYLYKPTLTDEGIRPIATVIVRLVAARSRQVIYARTFQYGYHVNTHSQSKVLLPPDEHVYESEEDLTANRTEANQRLVRALELIALNVAREVTDGDFASYLSPTMEDVISAGEGQASVESIGAAATEVAMKTYDEKLWRQSGELASGEAQKQAEIYIKLRSKRLAEIERKKKFEELAKLTNTSAQNPEFIVDVSGTYVSEITASGNANATKTFLNEKNRKEITLVQTGNTITGTDSSRSLKINGTREGSIVIFYILRGNEIEGVWEINADATRLEGKWKTNGGGGASGKWNLTRVGPSASIIENRSASGSTVSSHNPEFLVDVSGTYVSEITVSSGRNSFKNEYHRKRVTLEHNGNIVTGTDSSRNLQINGTQEGKVINFYVLRGNEIEGTWEINSDLSKLEGKWNTNGGGGSSGTWNLIRVR